jgi:predicted DCC family thiol-disulfide oxidoreductase YuxK
MSDEKKIILFDGVCNLCSKSVQFIIRRDKKELFLFGSLQGKAAQEYGKKFNITFDVINSFILIDQNKIYTRSSAALRVLNYLGNGWQLLYAFIIVPKFLRDGIYNFIANNRYKWFGKKEECWLPTPAWKEKFLD